MTTHPFLEANLKALETQNAPIFHWLAEQGLGPQDLDGNLITNQWGLLDWRLPSGKGLFDCLSPKLAYRDWTPTDRADTSATLIVGCNLGYGVNHVLSNTPNSHKVLVLEPRPEMLLACLSQTDYRPFFRAKKLFFVPPDLEFLRRVVWQLDLQYVFGNIFVLSDIPSHQMGPEYAIWTHHWTSSLRSVQKRLEKLFKKASRHQEKIHTVLNQILFFLRQDPLYQPYLYNEIFSLAGLINTRSSYGLKEMAECRGILKRVAKKVWEVDYHLIYNRKAA